MGASNTNTNRPRTWQRIVVLLVAAGSLVIPATASADPSASGYSRADAIAQGLEESGQSTGGSSYSSVSSIVGSVESSPVSSAPQTSSGYSSVNAVTGPSPSEPTFVSSPSSADDGFDWASAAIGAGATIAAMSLLGAALLTVRRRTTVAASTASMS
jgi:hypothetical protein